MAKFDDLDLDEGWWFYFQLRSCVDEEFAKEFIQEIERLFYMLGGNDVSGKQNDKKQKRIPVRSVQRKIY